MTTFALSDGYKTGFSITSQESGGSELMEQVRTVVSGWFGDLPRHEDSAEPVAVSDQAGELIYCRFQAKLPHGGAPDSQLYLEVKLSTDGGPVTARVESRFLMVEMESLSPNLLAGPPSLIWELIRAFDCYIGGDRLSWEPTVVTQGSAENFAHSRIFNPLRRLPIIAVSQDWRRQTPLNPNWLQNRLIGLAQVATYDGDTADQLRSLVGFQLACYGGAVRIYQPGCSAGDPRRQHQFWMPDRARALRSRPARPLLEEFIQYFADPVNPREYENVRLQIQQKRLAEREAEILARPLRQRIGELENEVDLLRQQSQESGWEEVAEESTSEIEALKQQLAKSSQKLDDAQKRVFDYELFNEDLERKIKQREDRIRNLEYQLRVRNSYEPSDFDYYDEPQGVGNVYEAIESAAQRFEYLWFLTSAYKSAEGYPFQRPGKVYDAFEALQELALARSEGRLDKSVEAWMKDRGCDYTVHEGKATMNKHGDTRQFGGYEMQEHIKIGSHTSNQQHYIRIHFAWQEESQQYVIGHVGEHLPTVTGG